MNIDLHCHSTNSDGTWSVEEILKEAEKKGVKGLCISDHDNLNGSIEAFEKAPGLFSGKLVAGIEISTVIHQQKVHLLAYFPTIDLPVSSNLIQNLDKIQNSRVWRMKEMIKKARALGMEVSYEEVLEEAGTGTKGDKQPTDVLSRPHLARVLIKKGYVKDFDEAFNQYLADGKPIQVDRFTLDFEQWIEQVDELNGIIIWAHPLHGHEEQEDTFQKIANTLKQSSIHGVERIYNYKGKYTISDEFEKWGNEHLDKLIEEQNWLITAGGDFHGNVGVIGELDLPETDWDIFIDQLYNRSN